MPRRAEKEPETMADLIDRTLHRPLEAARLALREALRDQSSPHEDLISLKEEIMNIQFCRNGRADTRDRTLKDTPLFVSLT